MVRSELLAIGTFATAAGVIYYIDSTNQIPKIGSRQAGATPTPSRSPKRGQSPSGSSGENTDPQPSSSVGSDESPSSDAGANTNDDSDEYVGDPEKPKAQFVKDNSEMLPDNVAFPATVTADSEGNYYNPHKYQWLQENLA